MSATFSQLAIPDYSNAESQAEFYMCITEVTKLLGIFCFKSELKLDDC